MNNIINQEFSSSEYGYEFSAYIKSINCYEAITKGRVVIILNSQYHESLINNIELTDLNYIKGINVIEELPNKDKMLSDEVNNARTDLYNYKKSFNVQYHSTLVEPLEKKISILDLSIVLDNLKSNSEKAGATELRLDFSRNGRTYIVDFTDNGVGVDLNAFTPENIFEEGITNRRGGSGIGLSTIKERMRENLNGDITFLGNGLHFKTGATFRLTFE